MQPCDNTLLRTVGSSTVPGDGLFARRWRHLANVATLAVLVLGLYWPVVGFDFVNWDDPWYVIDNPLIKSWHPANLWAIATEVAIKNYAPVTMLSYLVDHTLWGLWPGGYHLTNWLLHLVNTMLVYFLLAQVTRCRLVGWMTAALFAVHPVHIESVAWISSRKGLLAAGLILASLNFWLRPKRTGREEAYGLLFFVLALLSKAIAVVVPLVVLLYDMLIGSERFSRALPRQLIPGFLAVCLLSITMSAQTTEMGGVRHHMELNKPALLAVDSVIVWRYVDMLLWPRNLCVLYDPPTSGFGAVAAVAALGWLGVFWIAFRSRRQLPLVTLAIAAFFAFLLPVLNLFPITTLMNDRYLYLPSIPFFALLSGGLIHMAGRAGDAATSEPPSKTLFAARPALVALVMGGMLSVYSIMTRDHLPVWRNGVSLWQHTVRRVPQLPVVQIQLANTLHAQGRDREAVAVLVATLGNPRLDDLDRRRIREKLGDWRR